MFTDKFIKVPVILYNVKQADIVGYNNNTASDTSFIMIDPNEITYYRPSQSDDESDNFDSTLLWLKNGESFHINITIQEFETLLNSVCT